MYLHGSWEGISLLASLCLHLLLVFASHVVYTVAAVTTVD